MFKFLHTADIHLDSPLRGLESYEDAPVEQIRQATRRAFDNLIDLAVEEAVSFVLIVGDLYDGDWKDYNTGLFLVQRLSRLRKTGIRVFLVTGNHDAASPITRSLQLPDNVHLFSSSQPETVDIEPLNVAVHGQSYRQRAVTENLAQEYPLRREGCFNIGLLHTSLNGREGHEPYAPCTKSDLEAKGYDYWALGHVHQFEIVSEDPWIVFPGNIQGRHIRETGAKSATIVTVDDGEVTDIRQRDLDVLRWSFCTVDASSCDTTDALDLLVRQRLIETQQEAEARTLAVRLQISGRTPVHAALRAAGDACTQKYRELAVGLGEFWLEKIVIRTRSITSHRDLPVSDSPLESLMQSISDLDLTVDSIAALVPEISGLKGKLPPEIFEDEGLLLSDSPQAVAELADDVRELLIHSLLQHKDPE